MQRLQADPQQRLRHLLFDVTTLPFDLLLANSGVESVSEFETNRCVIHFDRPGRVR